ncbi:MAG: c-type cytochrome [Planctomycetaceae bacterium]|nr:c-type cytochrome [Planctomycetaceae bacterium]
MSRTFPTGDFTMCPRFLRLFMLGLILPLTCGVSSRVQAGQSNSLLAIDSSNTLIACSNRDSGSVTILSWPEMKKISEVPVGVHPEGVAWIPGTKQLLCCVYGDDVVSVIDAEKATVTQQINVFDEPYGVVCSEDGRFAYVTLEYPGQVVRINTSTWQQDAAWTVGAMPRGIAINSDSTALFVTEYLTSRLVEVSTVDGTLKRSWEPASTDNLCRQVTLSNNERKAYLTHIRSRVTAAHGNGSIFPYVSVATLQGEKSGQRVRVPMDSIRGARVTANPWETAVSPDDSTIAVIFGATNDMFLCRVINDDYSELDYAASIPLGNNPRAVRYTNDGAAILVYNALDFEVVAIDPASLKVIASEKVTQNPLTEDALLGKKLFYTALQPMSSRNWISCSSCHPDGDADGRTWQQPEGLRSTQPLAGLGWTHPVHWSADRDEVQDFEHTVRGQLMQGRGLMRGALPDALGDPISGKSKALDALAAYTNSHKFTLSPHSKNGLSEAARRGQQLFHSDRTKCASCHSGPFYTDSQPRPTEQIVRHDVGTGHDDPSELMAPAYDTPTLLGIYRSGPYLHHGKAETLTDVLTTWNKDDQHGVTSGLNESEIADLVEFLKALPFEDPEPAAIQKGLRKVVSRLQ